MDILAIDPGKYSGIIEIRNDTLFKSYTLDFVEMVENLAHNEWDYYKTWVVEMFQIYPWRARALAFDKCLSARIIGMIEFCSYQRNFDLILQNAGLAKGAITDEQLKKLKGDWFEKLKNQHERDAAKHALYFLIRKGRKINGEY